jgi:hypothetical protein
VGVNHCRFDLVLFRERVGGRKAGVHHGRYVRPMGSSPRFWQRFLKQSRETSFVERTWVNRQARF